MTRRHSVDVLQECMDLQEAKAKDYQNVASSVQQADYYPSGFKTILEIMHAKLLRMRSIVETFEQNPSSIPKFESLEDSCKDLINYASFGVSYLRYRMDGQISTHDILNRAQTNQAWLENCMQNSYKSSASQSTTSEYNWVKDTQFPVVNAVNDEAYHQNEQPAVPGTPSPYAWLDKDYC